MTCAHVVDVALKKVPGVDAVDVSLNKGLATVKFKEGNSVSVAQLWQLLHEKGYTPKTTAVSVRGELTSVEGRLSLKVSSTKQILTLAFESKDASAYAEAVRKTGQVVVIHGVMMPGKDLKAAVPLQVSQLK